MAIARQQQDMSADTQTGYVEGPRPYSISQDDHRGIVVAIATLFIIYAYMIIGMRLAARIRTMGVDDCLEILATLLATVQLSIVVGYTSQQFGTSFNHYSEHNANVVAQLLRASDVFLFMSLGVVKAAIIWLCRRLYPANRKGPRLLCDVALVFSLLWCFASILVVTIGCDDRAAIGLPGGRCSRLMSRWIVIEVLNGALELCILLLAMMVVWPLRMSLSRRLSAMSCFLFRLPILILMTIQLYYLSKFTHDPNKGVAITKPVVFRQAELLFSLFSAAIPALNQYLRRFDTRSAATFGYTPGTHSYGLESFSDRSRGRTAPEEAPRSQGKFPACSNRGNYHAEVEHESTKERHCDDTQDIQSIDRQNSDDMIIRKDMTYNVVHVDSETGLRERYPNN